MYCHLRCKSTVSSVLAPLSPPPCHAVGITGWPAESSAKCFLREGYCAASCPDVSLSMRAKESGKKKTFRLISPLRFVTSHSRFALASMRNRNPLRRRQVVGSYEVGKPTVAGMALAWVAVLAVPGIPFLSPFQRLPQKLVRL